METRDKKVVVTEIILTVVSLAQIVLSFVLYNKTGSSIVRITGWIFLMLSIIFGWLPVFSLKKWGNVPENKSFVFTTQLVDQGIYGIIRHPQYLAGILLSIAFVMIAQHWFIGILSIISIYINVSSSYGEEKMTYAKFGESYTLYKSRVPRFNFIVGLIRYFKYSRNSC